MASTALPVFSTVSQAYAAVSANSSALGAIALRTAVIAAIVFACTFALQSLALNDPTYAAEFDHLPAGERAASLTSLATLVVAVATFAILVRWHRLIIQGLPADATRKGAARAGFFYFARSLIIGAMAPMIAVVFGLLPAVLLQRASIVTGDGRLFSATLIASALIGALLVASRLSLVLPAAAVGNAQVTMHESWRLTRGNSWRLLLGSMLASGPAFAVAVAGEGLVRAEPTIASNTTSLMVASLLAMALTVLTAVIQASFLSYAYLFFAKDRSAS